MPLDFIRGQSASAFGFITIFEFKQYVLTLIAYKQIRASFSYCVDRLDATSDLTQGGGDLALVVVYAAGSQNGILICF